MTRADEIAAVREPRLAVPDAAQERDDIRHGQQPRDDLQARWQHIDRHEQADSAIIG